MSKFTPEEVARIRRESERLLRDPPARPERAPEPPRAVQIPESDPVQEWREWQDARAAEREACRAELRREADENRRVLSALERISSLEARVAEAERCTAQFDEIMLQLAQGTEAFSTAVNDMFDRMEKHLAELSRRLTELRSLDDVRRGGNGTIIDLPDYKRRAN